VSINNVAACLKMMHGVPGKEVTFLRPQDAEAFEAPLRDGIGVEHLGLDRGLKDGARLFTDAKLLAAYDEAAERVRKRRAA